jgi:hypothetical protein
VRAEAALGRSLVASEVSPPAELSVDSNIGEVLNGVFSPRVNPSPQPHVSATVRSEDVVVTMAPMMLSMPKLQWGVSPFSIDGAPEGRLA